jgi:hypothetical protein
MFADSWKHERLALADKAVSLIERDRPNPRVAPEWANGVWTLLPIFQSDVQERTAEPLAAQLGCRRHATELRARHPVI